MPHIVVKCYKGRSKEQLLNIAETIAKTTADAFEISKGKVSVSVEEVDKEEWRSIYKDEIWGNLDSLYVKPKYEME